MPSEDGMRQRGEREERERRLAALRSLAGQAGAGPTAGAEKATAPAGVVTPDQHERRSSGMERWGADAGHRSRSPARCSSSSSSRWSRVCGPSSAGAWAARLRR